MKRSSYFLIVVFLMFTCSSLFAQISFTKHLLDGNFARANGVVSVDLDGDGDMDILGSAIDANTVAWWENNGSQSFTKHIVDGNFSGALSVRAADIFIHWRQNNLVICWYPGILNCPLSKKRSASKQ